MKFIHGYLVAMTCAALAQAAPAADLGIDINLPADKQGSVRVALFDIGDDFPRGPAHRTAVVVPVNGRAQVQFTDLAPGRYAATAYLDENGNAQLDRNVFGMPVEVYGFSREARGMAGPPTFTDAAFSLGEGTLTQSFQLK